MRDAPPGEAEAEHDEMYASILAGGSGTRLLPLSTPESPKQLLPLPGPWTMLQETVQRVAPLAPLDQIYVVTSRAYRDVVGAQLPGLARGNVVGEPVGRGTAASIGLAAVLIAARDPQAVMGSFASDHAIADVEGFRAALTLAEEVARQGYLVTLGIQPTGPETGYGYIRFGALLSHTDELGAHRVEGFVEKPARQVAEEYLHAGNYVWNAGIFVWRVDRILQEIRRYVPAVADVLDEFALAARVTGGRVTPGLERGVEGVWSPAFQEVALVEGGVVGAAHIAPI